jgi:type II secretory pathway pseudopilin PulG
MRKDFNCGFTLIETVISSALMAMIVVAAVGSWLLFLHKSNRVNQQAMLDLDARRAVESFRHEVRNGARETVMFYPEHQQPYEAIGFALAKDTDNDGLMDMDANGSNILWRETVVYHIWRGSDVPQMRRTFFDNRNNEMEHGDYYQQLETVVRTGSGTSACLPGERSSTKVLFENLFTGKLWHAEANFDCYAPVANTREEITFGSIPLGAGAHQVDLTITGKHPDSSGRRLHLDQLRLGVSGWPMEAESLVYGGSSASTVFIGPNLAGAAYGLDVATASDGNTISLLLYNDAIDEAEFIGAGRNVAFSNTVVRFDDEFFPAGRDQGSYATMLDGNYATAWYVGKQTADGVRSVYFYPTNCLIRIPIMAPWVSADGYGPVFRLYKSLYNNNLQIINPHYAVADTPLDGSPPAPFFSADDNIPLEFYQNGARMSSWTACAKMDYVDLRPSETTRIEPLTTLMLTFEVRISNYKSDRGTASRMLRPGLPGCWIMLPQTNAVSATGDIVMPDPATATNNFDTIELMQLPFLESMTVNYADQGDYISHVYDTRSDVSSDKIIKWESDIPTGAELRMYARSGNSISEDGFEISDASKWQNVTEISNGERLTDAGRYLQFRAVMKSQAGAQPPNVSSTKTLGPYRRETPRLHRVLITWDGEEQYVDITGSLLKSPDCGIFKVEVDGKPLIKGVTMEIEIFKDIKTMGNRKERLRSTMMAEIEPRNSKKR